MVISWPWHAAYDVKPVNQKLFELVKSFMSYCPQKFFSFLGNGDLDPYSPLLTLTCIVPYTCVPKIVWICEAVQKYSACWYIPLCLHHKACVPDPLDHSEGHKVRELSMLVYPPKKVCQYNMACVPGSLRISI